MCLTELFNTAKTITFQSNDTTLCTTCKITWGLHKMLPWQLELGKS